MGDWTPEELATLRRKQPSCQDCGKRMTWSDRCRQFARLAARGWAADLIRSTGILPRCQKCLTRWLRDHAPVGGPDAVPAAPVDTIGPGVSPDA